MPWLPPITRAIQTYPSEDKEEEGCRTTIMPPKTANAAKTKQRIAGLGVPQNKKRAQAKARALQNARSIFLENL
jgi:hypothetical protein